ncbi:MAG TPA: 2-succinyl-5-enolpyruvyl-6-hydroxy-3-cyclohexene-1-carboxylic-acid synthase [Chitinophagaceae bacterium]|nr:2-succinyl-5-enolpyruvyl-6-hydroxy-3-cyclohexene-1-carboxylic-acid synthase [Chitinophagaceae bacterium]
MILSNKKGIQQIVTVLSALGLKEVILCPGSRDAPLMISFNRHPDIHCTSIRDERSAAFFALGKVIELAEPVAVVCSSGSAALNFSPAISEAYYQRVPLLVLTADRPKEWTDQGDGQIINQTNIYQNYIRKSYDLKGEVCSQTDEWYNNRCLCEGYGWATCLDRGPVHFNVPLCEPLYETEDVEEVNPKVFKIEQPATCLSAKNLNQLSQDFLEKKRVMILVGQYPKDKKLQEELGDIAQFKNVTVLTESTSNIHHASFIENIDRCITHLNEQEIEELKPDLLISMGGAIVSKRIKKLLRVYKPIIHWNIHPFESTMDTYQSLTNAIPMEPACFLTQLKEHIHEISSDYNEKWQKIKQRKINLHQSFVQKCGYSDFKVFSLIYQNISTQINLHISNSSAIRYVQLFDNQNVAYTYSNRGTSGIDGCTSTAMGAASVSPQKEFLLITGDVAFHYDINALWNEENIENLRIVVLNNSGGNIFRIIPGPGKVEELEQYFETSMKTETKEIAAHYHWNYFSAHDEASLNEALKKFFSEEGKRSILEVFTDAKTNPRILKEYWEFLQ